MIRSFKTCIAGTVRTRAFIMLVCVSIFSQAWSEEPVVEPVVDEGPWSGKLGLGFSSIDGNTRARSLSVDADVNYDAVKWHHTLIGRVKNNEANGVTNARAYKAGWTSKFDLSERTYLFGQLDYNKVKFSGYQWQAFEIFGIGYRFINSEKHKLNGEVGAGAGQSKLNVFPSRPSENEFTGRASADYTWNISDNASFVQKLSVSTASSNTFLESLTELRAGIVGNINMVLSYAVQNNSDVQPGIKKTDTFTTIALEYAF